MTIEVEAAEATEATEAIEAEAFRWCRGGPPNPERPPRAMPEMLDGLGPGLVVCGCPWAWTCEDPETTTPHDELLLRKPGPRRRRSGRPVHLNA